MKKITFLVCALFFISSYAQTQDQKGYFINNQGIRTDCQIKNMDWKNNPNEFEYRISENDSYTNVSIDYAKEFGLEDVTFVRADVDIDQSSEKLATISKDKNPIFVNQRVFLRVLVNGSAKLYHYFRDDMNRFFFSVGESPIEQLLFKSYFATDLITIRQNTTFRKQLLDHVNCEKTDFTSVQNLEYKQNQLINYFESVNACKGDVVVENKNKNRKKGSFNLKIAAIVNNNSLDMNSDISRFDFDFGKKTGFAFGLEAEYIMPFNNNKWSIFIDPSYNSFKAEGTNITEFITEPEDLSVELKYLQIPFGVRYYFFLNQKSRIFINGAFNYMVVSGSSTIDFERHDSQEFVSNKLNFAFGMGYSYQKFSIEFRYYTAANVSQYIQVPYNYTNTALALKYKFL